MKLTREQVIVHLFITRLCCMLYYSIVFDNHLFSFFFFSVYPLNCYSNTYVLVLFSLHLPVITDSPRHFWWYHLICWLMSAAGIICILVAHEHYTVDVIIAYYITTRLFWWYHSMANEKVSGKYV